MKRALVGILLISALACPLRAADAVVLAAQQEMQDNYRRLTATFEELQAAQLALQKQVSGLATEVGKLRDEIGRNNNSVATQEALRELNKQILKVDEQHVADNKRVQEAIEKLGGAIKSISTAPPARPRTEINNTGPASPPSTGGRSPAAGSPIEDGFDYVVQKGDYLGKIVKSFREEKIMVTSEMVMAANPKVDWNRLQVGTHIFIPKPK